MKPTLNIDELSSHLFWDVDKKALRPDQHKKLIIQRVLEYGLWEDWKAIYSYYGKNTIHDIVGKLRDIDEKSAAFVALVTNTRMEDYKCFTTIQSKDRLWNY
jgi:hypothetical protein